MHPNIPPAVDEKYHWHWQDLERKAGECGLSTEALSISTGHRVGGEAGDSSAGRIEKELTAALLSGQANTKALIRSAQQRLLNGSYGTCVACEEEIKPNRLKAASETPLCTKCQEMAERGELQGVQTTVPVKMHEPYARNPRRWKGRPQERFYYPAEEKAPIIIPKWT